MASEKSIEPVRGPLSEHRILFNSSELKMNNRDIGGYGAEKSRK